MTTALEPVRRSQIFPGVSPQAVYQVVTEFEGYPRVFKEIAAARVLEREGPRVRVEFRVPMMVPVRYVLDLVCQEAALSVDWTFVEGDVVTNNQGGWRFSALGPDTKVDYHVSLAVKAPVPGFVLKKITDGLVSASLPGMFRALEAEVRRRLTAADPA